jgi:phage gp36-like protein
MLITDAQLLAMGLAVDALTGIDVGTRDIARAAASDHVLSYVAKRYTLPLIEWSDDLRRATAHVASWDLLSTRGYAPIAGGDEAIKDRYDAAIRWLERVADGRVEPVGVVDSTPTIAEAGPLVSTDGEPLWPAYGRGAWGRRDGCC